ncbi:TPA: peptide ABC transporter substrate-binding protein [Candidatus Saccharibacteria bacterium]|nr:peptide ABC transporter substrate-binding protein [Candidatus Saccharibacteria bacterium]HIO87656.1 peptide ABC transporter substrate-binding protein [Candidatus Saccharibacteria bacterium]
MFRPYIKFKTKRFIRRLKKLPAKSWVDSLENIDKTVVKRWKKFRKIRRFATGWLVLCTALIAASLVQISQSRQTSLKQIPTQGGVYREAVVGKVNNLNPLFALDGANADIAGIVFDSLLVYDAAGNLSPSLATKIIANEAADEFTLQLRDDVVWHDGEQFDSSDVRFTVDLLQNKQVGSIFSDTWEGVIVETPDPNSVIFKLPNSFAPFPHLLRQLILPEHKLHAVDPASIRSSEFSINPVGTGAYEVAKIDGDSGLITLTRNENYYRGEPYIRTIEIELFEDSATAQNAFDKGLVDGFGKQDNISSTATDTAATPTKLAAGSYLFFNTKNDILKTKAVRQALTQLVDKSQIYTAQTFQAPLINNPFLPQQLAVDNPSHVQLPHNAEKGRQQLDAAGFVRSDEGLRIKDGQVLSLTILAADTLENRLIVEGLQKSWQPEGIDVYAEFVSVADFQSRSVASKNYQVVLATIQNGLDLDNFVFWHSSQAGLGGLNFSRLENSIIDSALEAGRTRTDRNLRIAKYEAFLEQWRDLSPAVALHQSLYDYQQTDRIKGYSWDVLSRTADRFTNIHEWYVRTESISQVE